MLSIKTLNSSKELSTYFSQQFPRHESARANAYKLVQEIIQKNRHPRVKIWETQPEEALKKIQASKKCVFDETTKKTVTFIHGFDRLVDSVAGSCFSFLQTTLHPDIGEARAKELGLKAFRIIIPCEISRKSTNPADEIDTQRAMICYEMTNHSFKEGQIKVFRHLQLFHRCINLETNPDFAKQAVKYNYSSKKYFLSLLNQKGVELPQIIDLESDKEQAVFDQNSSFLYLKTPCKTLFKFYMLHNKPS